MKTKLCCLLLCVVVAKSAAAAPVLNGVRDASYGSAIAWQTVQTGFVDNENELNAAYAQVEGGMLYLMLTGQVKNSKLNIFFDSVAGGQNVLENNANFGGTNPENDNWASKHAGMTFDNGFEADYVLILRNGDQFGDGFDIDFATIGGGLGAFEAATDVFNGSLTGSNAAALPNGIGVGYNSSNVLGVVSGNAAANQAAALAVSTGIELAIPLSALGGPSEMKIVAMINGSNHDFLSNQFLPGLPPPQVNLGGDGAGTFTGTLSQIDLNNFAGDQYFRVVVPEPSAFAIALGGLVIGAVAMCRRRTERR